MSYFGTIDESHPDYLPDDATISPDDRYITKVTHRGVLPKGLSEATIWLFDVAEVLDSIQSGAEAPHPVALRTMSAAVNGTGNFFDRDNVVSLLRWRTEDSLLFRGRMNHEGRQVFATNLETGETSALTRDDQDVFAYSVTANGEVIYLSSRAVDESQLWNAAHPNDPDIVAATGTPLAKLLFPRFRGYSTTEHIVLDLCRSKDGATSPVFAHSGEAVRVETKETAVLAEVSADGSTMLTISRRDGESDLSEHGAYERYGDHSSLEFQLVDLTTGERRSLNGGAVLDLQWGRTGRFIAAWHLDVVALTGLTDTCRVSLVNSDGTIGACVVPVAPSDRRLVHSIVWNSSSSITIGFKDFGISSLSEVVFSRLDSGKWAPSRQDLTGELKSSLSPILLSVRESLNEPPVLVATDSRSGRSREIYNPNPELARLKLGQAKEFNWKTKKGTTVRGGLVLPPGYREDKVYPLVIQTHGFDPNRFMRVGFSETSNAARAIAARDIVVLQVQEPAGDPEKPWTHASVTALDAYISAIDHLAADGIVDPSKVGISGYSYTGWLAATAIVEAPDRFKAAVIANTDPATITGYFSYVDTGLAELFSGMLVGGPPHGETLELWLERSPALSTEKVEAAVLVSVAEPYNLITLWDFYAALRDQGKDVELQYIRSGTHNISKPLHKLAHQSAIVDWFDQWLNGNETSAHGWKAMPVQPRD